MKIEIFSRHKMMTSNRAQWYNGNAVDSYLGSSRFEYLLRHVFRQFLKADTWIVLLEGHYRVF